MFHSFPEALFLPEFSRQEEYITRVFSGREIARNSRVLICGLVRDASNYSCYLYHRLMAIASPFAQAHIILYENDSKDKTVDKLYDHFDERPNRLVTFEILSERLSKKRNAQDKSSGRRADMAYYRNQYLAKAYERLPAYDYMIVLDTDICGGYSYEGIYHSLTFMDKYDAIGSNSLLYRVRDGNKERLYYDAWAFRQLGAETEHLTTEVNTKLQLKRGEPIFDVNSAFGGLAVYKKDLLCQHNPFYTDEDCDHVTLHKQLRAKGGRIGLNPSQIVLYSPTIYTGNREFE